MVICNGQLREATNDNASGAFEAGHRDRPRMYPKQPFDFAGPHRDDWLRCQQRHARDACRVARRCGCQDKPVPAPFNHFDSWIALPQHGFGIRFAAQVGPGQYGFCPNDDNTSRWTVDSAVVVRDYVFDDTNGFGNTVA